MPRKKVTLSGNKKNPQSLLIMILFIIIGVETFLLINKNSPSHLEQNIPVVKVASSTLPVKQAIEARVDTPVRHQAAILPEGKNSRIAIIIDDWGYSKHNCQYLKEIDEPLTVAVLPDLPFSNDIMDCAIENKKDIILHLPLEAKHNDDTYPEDYLLKASMGPAKIERLLNGILDRMPLIVGINNHMGSKATEDKRIMSVIFKVLKKRNLFFIDSMTSNSICMPLAQQFHLPFAKRDIFLDNDKDKGAIEKQVFLLAQKARKNGYAIGIGHDRKMTMQVLKEQLPRLKSQGYKIVYARELVQP